MKLKYCLSIVLLCGFISVSFSQKGTSTYDARLLAKYSSEYLDNLPAEEIDYLNYVVENSYYFMDYPTGKNITTRKLLKVDPQTKSESEVLSYDEVKVGFNPYMYNCEIGSAGQTYYTIGETGKILVMRSKLSLEMRYKSFKTKNNQINNK